jgi:tRNA(Ile2) C34 agmatinyltransferase TiaS
MTCVTCRQPLTQTDRTRGFRRCKTCRTTAPGNPKIVAALQRQAEQPPKATSWWIQPTYQQDRQAFMTKASTLVPTSTRGPTPAEPQP